jgi:transcription termination/antitermination protein NusA
MFGTLSETTMAKKPIKKPDFSGEEVLRVVSAIAKQKELPEDIIFEALEQALALVIAKNQKKTSDVSSKPTVKVDIDRNTGDFVSTRHWKVTEHFTIDNPDEDQPHPADPGYEEISLADAQEIQPSAKYDDLISKPVSGLNLGRIDASLAKHVITRIVKDAERAKKAKHYEENMLGEIITAEVIKSTRDFVTIDLGDTQGIFHKEDIIPKEPIRQGDHIKGLVCHINAQEKGPLVQLSRTKNAMLEKLFHIEVPEIAEGIIEIKGIARDPGSRAKVAVKTNDGRIDPVGACVGMRGSRVQAVSAEINGERIDIIHWDDDPVRLVTNALAPAEIKSIQVDADTQTMAVLVEEDQLPQAIGRGGQNIRLASELTKWTLNVASKTKIDENKAIYKKLAEALEIDEEIASILVREGLSRLELIAHASEEKMHTIEEFDPEIIEEICLRAKNALLAEMVDSDTLEAQASPQEDLLAMKTITEPLAYQLAKHGIFSKNDLAESDIGEITEYIEGLSEDDAATMIMEARETWFNNVQDNES